MTRHVSRRSVVKLAYATPLVAVSMRLGLSGAAAVSGGPFCVTGHVYDAVTGQGIPAFLDLPGVEVFADPTGFYGSIPCLSEGGYQVVSPGYVEQFGVIDLTGVTVKDWYLEPE